MAQSSRKSNRVKVDMDALICLDMQHQWRLLERGNVLNGPFRGAAQRSKLCMICGSLKVEVLNWRGYVVSRHYKTDPVYLAESRKLADNVNERRAAYRKLLIGRPPKPPCDICGIIHESADCPI